MYQESDDKLKGSGKKDALLFILLIVFFLAAGTLATVLKTRFNSNVPLYVLALVFGGLLILVYKLRICGWRYTVFYKEPETEYDARFDEYIKHEDHPYPVGTVVVERTISAKGEILAVINREDMIALLEPGESCSCDSELHFSPRKKELCSSLVFNNDGKKVRLYFSPTEEFKNYLRGLLENE